MSEKRRSGSKLSEGLKDALVLSAIGFIVSLGQGLISPILPLYALSFGVTVAAVGLLIASTSLARVFLDIPAGTLADRIGVRRFLIAGLVTVSLSAVISGAAVEYWMLLFGLVLQGVGSAIYLTVAYIAISRVVPRQRRGRLMGLYVSLQFLGASAGPVLGGVVGQLFGLNVPFYLYATLVLLCVPLLRSAVRSADVDASAVVRKEHGQMRAVFRDRSLVAVDLGLFAISLLRSGLLLTIVPLFASAELSMPPAMLGTVLTLSAAANFAVILPVGSLSDKVGRRTPLVASLALSAVVVLALSLASDALSFGALMVALGLALGLTGSIGAWIADIAAPSQLGTAMGTYRTVGDLGALIGPVLLTALIGSNASIGVLPFAITAGVLLAAAAAVSRARDPAGDARRAMNKNQ